MADASGFPEITSEFLLDAMEGRGFGDDDENTPADREATRLVRRITRNILNSRQALADLPIERLDDLMSSTQAAGWMMDDLYCHELLKRVPKMVRRTLELSSLTIPADRLPKGSVHVFYEQAVRCYIFGLWQAAAVLARGTVETALREKLEGRPLEKLVKLIDAAVQRRILTGPAIEAANVVKVLGDHAAHGQEMKPQDAKKLVMCAREVALALFGGRMGDESRPG